MIVLHKASGPPRESRIHINLLEVSSLGLQWLLPTYPILAYPNNAVQNDNCLQYKEAGGNKIPPSLYGVSQPLDL